MTLDANVLIVDENSKSRLAAKTFFDNNGAKRIHGVGNIGELELVLPQLAPQVEIIVCDLRVTGLDADEFLQKLKSHHFCGQLVLAYDDDRQSPEQVRACHRRHGINIRAALRAPITGDALERLFLKKQDWSTVAIASAATITGHDVARAIDAQEIVPFYQPKVDVATRKVIGVEALARWRDEAGKFISPGQFIPLAKRNGLTARLNTGILRQTIEDAARWRQKAMSLSLAVNIDAELLDDPAFAHNVSNGFLGAKLEASDVIVEVSESGGIFRRPAAFETLSFLKSKGFQVSLDEFGTGFSNATQIGSFSFSELKIDQSVIRAAAIDRFARLKVEASAKLGGELGLRMVAVGIETEEDCTFIEACGIQHMQGFFIARPMPATELENWYAENSGSITIPSAA